jgi:hypothetical protein
MRRAAFVVAGALAVFLVSFADAAGQEQRGAIEGVVRDSSGAVLPGVTVEARSPALVGAAVTVTDASGLYRFPGLMPGVYEVSATLSGFNTGKAQGIVLALGQILKADIVLSLAGVSETVEVTAGAAVLDLKQNASAASIHRDMIERLPKGRDFTTIVTITPGANQESKLAGISVDGASGAENRFYVDGIDTSHIWRGTSAKSLMVDVVDEVQVKSSGYNAEFGGAMGGVISVTTKTGSNEWRGSIGTYYTSDALTGRRRETLRLGLVDDRIAEYVRYDDDSFSDFQPAFTLGGPVSRDRAWFFASYMPSFQTTDRAVTFRLNGETGNFSSRERVHHFSSNLTAQITPKIRAKASFNMAPYSRSGQLPAIDGTSNPAFDFPTLGRKEPNRNFSASIDYLASNKLYVSVRGGYFSYDIVDTGVPDVVRFIFFGSNAVYPEVPAALVRDNNFSNVPSNSASMRDKMGRYSIYTDATYYASFAGQHAFKAGVQFDLPSMDVYAGEQQDIIRVYWDRARTTLAGDRVSGPYGYYMKSRFYTTGDVSTHQAGLFVQDSWTINRRLTVNAGLRTEAQHLPSFIPEYPGMDFNFSQKIAPRLGFALDVLGDARWKAYGSWGIFYDATKMGFQRGIFGGEKLMQYYYTLDTYDWLSLGAGSCVTGGVCPGTFIEQIDRRIPSNHPDLDLIDPDVKPMSSQEMTIGLEHELNRSTLLAFRVVHKGLGRVLEDVGVVVPGVGYRYYVANPGYGLAEYTIGREYPAQPKAKRTYDALEMRLRRRLTNGLALNASYLWSRLWGNYTGLVSSDEEARVAPNATRNFDAIYMSFDEKAKPVYGLLPTDRPHQFKSQLMYDFPAGIAAGVTYSMMSGIPVSRTVPQAGVDMYYQGRGSDGRTPTFSQTDLYLSYRLNLPGGQRRVTLDMNVLNLFDQKIATNIFRSEIRDDLGLTNAQFFQGFDVQQIVSQRGLRRDPRFLMPSAFQGPRAMTLSCRFTF